ncbi:MAG: CocE/NonD family hydrolase [Alphaproteobacteria bacterium]|nr:CocE/NonD family hydrolase [Alphaproteobacteria bacterium]MCB9930236.1 CocE/NonD family hydrolase [Alphaproteobacteria bacterium]
MTVVEMAAGVRGLQAFVEMRDGVRLNTLVFLPAGEGPWPVILARTPYGITQPQGRHTTDPAHGWLPDPAQPLRGSILRGWQAITGRGYVCVYQDTRGRYASEGEDRVYCDDAEDGYDTLDWIAEQPWCNGRIGMAGSSAGATTTLAAASQGHPALKAYWAQVGGSSIYNDVVCEGQSIEMERLWLWVSKNIPGLSESHKRRAMRLSGLDEAGMAAAHRRAGETYTRLEAASRAEPPFVDNADWLRLPLLDYPDFSAWQPFLNALLSHPAPDAFRNGHDFRKTIAIPGFHATSWYDIFLTSVLAAFREVQARTGTQKLWIGPNDHYFIYESQFWTRDPFFEWFGHYLKDEPAALIDEPAVHFSPRAFVADRAGYKADDWLHSATWPPAGVEARRLYLTGDGGLGAVPAGGPRTYVYDPRRPNPTLGGRNMLIGNGRMDQRPAQQRPDYGLIYTGEPLAEPMTLSGPVRVTLHAGSDCPDTDFIAKLNEVLPDGTALLLMDGVTRAMFRDSVRHPARTRPRRLAPGEVCEIVIDLGDIRATIPAGHRLQVDIVSSNFPRRARNTNSGHVLLAADGEADIRTARNTVHHDDGLPSYIELTIALPG